MFQSPSGRFFYLDRPATMPRPSSPIRFQSPSGRFLYLDGDEPILEYKEILLDRGFQSPSGRFFYLDEDGNRAGKGNLRVSIAFRAILLFRPNLPQVDFGPETNTVSIAFRAILLFRRKDSIHRHPTDARVSIAFRAILLFRR